MKSLNLLQLGFLLVSSFMAVSVQALDSTEVVSAQFVDVNNLGSIKSVLATDYLQQAEHAVEGQNSQAPGIEKVRKILVYKSAVRLQMPLSSLLAKHMSEFPSLQKSMGFTYDPRCNNNCDIVERIKYMGFLHVNVSLNLEVQAYDLTQMDDDTKQILKGLGVDAAAYELRVFGRNWSNIFTETQSVSYYIPHGDSAVDVVTYQIASIKDASYNRIPGLEGIVKSEMRTQLDTMVNFLRSRSPASSQFDEDLYEQDHYELVDTVGDEVLIKRASVVPLRIVKFFVPKSKKEKAASVNQWTPEPWELIEPSNEVYAEPVDSSKPSLQGRERPLKIKELTTAFAQVIAEEAKSHQIIPSIGFSHEWSSETLKKYSKNPFIKFSKLLVALSMGFSDRFMKTDQEEPLRDWILAQAYNSITLPELFRRSYQLNQGDVYLSILSIENVLSSNWRYAQREDLPTTRRLRAISSGYNYDSDRYGTWYHLFGMILYGYAQGAGAAGFIGRVEALGSNTMSMGQEDQTQKQWMNKDGGSIGEKLRDLVINGSWTKISMDQKNLGESTYLNKDEDFRDRLKYELSQEIRAYGNYEDGHFLEISLNNVNQDLKQCRVDIIFAHGNHFDSRFKASFDQQDLPQNKTVYLRSNIPSASAMRVFVYNCEGSDQEYVMEAQIQK